MINECPIRYLVSTSLFFTWNPNTTMGGANIWFISCN